MAKYQDPGWWEVTSPSHWLWADQDSLTLVDELTEEGAFVVNLQGAGYYRWDWLLVILSATR